MNVEGITLLNQFVEYSCKPFVVIILLIIGAIIGLYISHKSNVPQQRK